MNCIILGDKYQNGMKSRGCSALLRISSKTTNIDHQCSILSSIFDNPNVLYVYGFDNKKFIEFVNKSTLNINIIYNEYYNNYNEAFSLSLVKDNLKNDATLIIDGYQKINKTILKKIKLDREYSYVFVDKNTKHDPESVGCIINKNNCIESLSLDLDNAIQNIYYLNENCSKTLSEILENKRNYNNFIFELLNKLIDHGHKIKPIQIN